MARPERFELPTLWFVARYSIQLSYGRAEVANLIDNRQFRQELIKINFAVENCYKINLISVAESEGFEPSVSFWPTLT